MAVRVRREEEREQGQSDPTPRDGHEQQHQGEVPQFEAESEGVDPAGHTAISTQPTDTRPGAAAPGAAAAAVILVVIVDDASVGSYSCPGTGHSGDRRHDYFFASCFLM